MSKQSLEPAVTVELATEYGLSRTNISGCWGSPGGRRRSPNSASSVMWSSMLVQVIEGLAEAIADNGAPCHLRSRRERRRDRHRRRPGRHLQDGKPQPPSFIEPYQGAATGVGGILRDVFTMGARPIAGMNSLRFGSPDHPKTRHLVSGVVAGIGGYGNCVGVPTVGGETNFHPSFNGNILVNAMTVGLAGGQDLLFGRRRHGNPVVYVGSKTGRDGIHGATMASTEFSETRRRSGPPCRSAIPSPRSC